MGLMSGGEGGKVLHITSAAWRRRRLDEAALFQASSSCSSSRLVETIKNAPNSMHITDRYTTARRRQLYVPTTRTTPSVCPAGRFVREQLERNDGVPDAVENQAGDISDM